MTPFVTADQLYAHAVGDYVLQTSWMSREKHRRAWVAVLHALVYSLPFVAMFRPSALAWLTIFGTHAVIDHLRLARYVAWAVQHFAPDRPTPLEETTTGYPAGTPDWLAGWLLIIVDNLMHVTVNAAALRYL